MTGMPPVDTRIVEWKERFRRAPLAEKVVLGLEGRAQEIWQRTFGLLRQESPEYRNAIDDQFTAESKGHCGELLETIVAVAAGRMDASDPFAFVRKHAEWRARHQVPLVASLHAYRLAHKTYWGLTREVLAQHRKQKEALNALEMLSDFWIELFEAVGGTLEEAHGAEEARIVAQNTRTHAAIIEDLLSGIEPSGVEARQLLTLCGMRPAKTMALAVIRPSAARDGKLGEIEIASRSLVRHLHQVLPSSAFGKLVGRRNGEIVVVANGDGDTAGRLIMYLSRHGFGRKAGAPVRAHAGVSIDKFHFAELPDALAEARIALDFTNSSRTIQHFAEINLSEFVVHRTDKASLRLIPQWVRDAHATGVANHLLETVRTFAECSLNVKETARRLDVHANTVYFRLKQIKQRTGVDPRTFAGTSFLLMSLRLLDVHNGSHRSQ